MKLDPTFAFELQRNFKHEARERFRMVRWGIVSEKRLGEIFETACDTLESGGYTSAEFVYRGQSAREIFASAVKDRYEARYGFDPLTWILIFKLVLLFVELFIKFTGSESHAS